VVFQADLEEKLARLEELLQQQPEGGGGVAFSVSTPAQVFLSLFLSVPPSLSPSLSRDLNSTLKPKP